ncbi:MAG: YihY/virulence factor BrkB family protein [Bacteroidia bacterium]|nr:YihY/virulence factor BrkB family protein [Bacteroidia bacterium]
MEFKIQHLDKLFKRSFQAWISIDPFRESAIIAYYAIFSIPGLLLLIVTVMGYFFGNETVNNDLVNEISKSMGASTAAQISQILEKANESKATLWGSIVGVIILLIGATGVFVELQKTLNLIWQVKTVTQNGILPILKARLFSFGLILAIAFLLTISLVISTAIAAMSNWIKVDSSPFMISVFSIINFSLSLAVISFLFALMFKVLPDAEIKWKHVWFGSLITGILFTLGKTALAYYFGKANPESVYGAAGSVILILLWVSYSSIIMFFGAEFTYVYAKTYTGVVAPTDIAKAT